MYLLLVCFLFFRFYWGVLAVLCFVKGQFVEFQASFERAKKWVQELQAQEGLFATRHWWLKDKLLQIGALGEVENRMARGGECKCCLNQSTFPHYLENQALSGLKELEQG